MKPALILFYALVLTQGALFLLWFTVAVIRSWEAAEIGSLYHLSPDLIERYVGSIAATCIEKGVATTINTNLVSFAAELLLQSQHPDDHTPAVQVLYLLVVFLGSEQAVKQICSSEKLVYRLVRMLCSDELDADSKRKNAEIVYKLACKLRLADIPGAAHCISSLLDRHHMKKAAQTGRNCDFHSIDIDIDERAEIKPLFLHGLVILGELASDSENCREIYSTLDLVPKIIEPVRNGLHIVFKDDAMTVEIVRESLPVVDKLITSGMGECNRKLCHELTTKYGRTAENILWILNNSSDAGMAMLAVKILSRLTLDEPRMLQFTVDLQRLPFAPEDIQLRIETGKALIARGDIQLLVIIMSADAYSKEYRAVTAEMLAQLCASSRAEQNRSDHLNAVANALSTVLKAIVTETTGIINRKFLASFLGLAVQIREKLVTAEAFMDAVTGLPMGNNIFAEKLEMIIEMTNDSEDEICLAIMKSVTKLVTWMTEMNTIGPGHYIEESFQLENIVKKLKDAVEAMAHLERYVFMTGSADESEGYETLQTLVETASNKLVSPSWQER